MNAFRRLAPALAAGSLCLAAATLTLAQGYPSKQIDLIVPYAPGGTTDFVTRVIGQKLGESWGQAVVVLNRPGASGALGAEQAAAAPPDGHTLVITGYTNRLLLFAPAPPAPNPGKDLVPVVMVAKSPLLVLTHPDLPVRSLSELVALAKAKPGTLNYASIGNGSPSHLAMEMLKMRSGIDLTHVPYKGSGPALLDLIAGHVRVMIDSVVSSSPHVKAGKLRALAVTTSARLPTMPELPTVAESGLPGFDAFTWTALYAPGSTAPERIEKLRQEVARILKLPDVIERFSSQGAIIPEPMSLPQVAAYIDADIVGWRKFIKDANIQAD